MAKHSSGPRQYESGMPQKRSLQNILGRKRQDLRLLGSKHHKVGIPFAPIADHAPLLKGSTREFMCAVSFPDQLDRPEMADDLIRCQVYFV